MKNVCELQDTSKSNNLWITGVPEGEEREKGAESLFKDIMAENFPNLGPYLGTPIHESIKLPQNFSSKWSSPGHFIIKLSKTKDREF